jgi:hypothetical protein
MTTPAFDIPTIKEDLGVTGSTPSDAWWNRRIAAIWSAFQRYTHRQLSPKIKAQDDFSSVFEQGDWYGCRSRASIFLTHFPVINIVSFEIDSGAGTLANLLVDKSSGKILSLDGVNSIYDSGWTLQSRLFKVIYNAGWDLADIPSDLYEALIGILRQQYAVWSSQSNLGFGGMVPNRVSVMDVGDVALGPNATAAEAAALKGGFTDPLLGAWETVLDPYVDHRRVLGSVGTPVVTVVT